MQQVNLDNVEQVPTPLTKEIQVVNPKGSKKVKTVNTRRKPDAGPLLKIVAIAKEIRAKNPSEKWKECIKKASIEYNSKKK